MLVFGVSESFSDFFTGSSEVFGVEASASSSIENFVDLVEVASVHIVGSKTEDFEEKVESDFFNVGLSGDDVQNFFCFVFETECFDSGCEFFDGNESRFVTVEKVEALLKVADCRCVEVL